MFRGCQGASGGLKGVLPCQKRHRLSSKVDECKPLPVASCGENVSSMYFWMGAVMSTSSPCERRAPFAVVRWLLHHGGELLRTCRWVSRCGQRSSPTQRTRLLYRTPHSQRTPVLSPLSLSRR